MLFRSPFLKLKVYLLSLIEYELELITGATAAKTGSPLDLTLALVKDGEL